MVSSKMNLDRTSPQHVPPQRGLTVQELKAMTALRLAQNQPVSNSNKPMYRNLPPQSMFNNERSYVNDQNQIYSASDVKPNLKPQKKDSNIQYRPSSSSGLTVQELKELTQLRLNSSADSAYTSDHYYDSDSAISATLREKIAFRTDIPQNLTGPGPQSYSSAKKTNASFATVLPMSETTNNSYMKSQPYRSLQGSDLNNKLSSSLSSAPSHTSMSRINGYATAQSHSTDQYTKTTRPPSTNNYEIKNYDNISRQLNTQKSSISNNISGYEGIESDKSSRNFYYDSSVSSNGNNMPRTNFETRYQQQLPSHYQQIDKNSIRRDSEEDGHGNAHFFPPGFSRTNVPDRTLSLKDPGSYFQFSNQNSGITDEGGVGGNKTDHDNSFNQLLAELGISNNYDYNITDPSVLSEENTSNGLPTLRAGQNLVDPSQLMLLTNSPRSRLVAAAAQSTALSNELNGGSMSPPRSPKTMRNRSKLPLPCPPLLRHRSISDSTNLPFEMIESILSSAANSPVNSAHAVGSTQRSTGSGRFSIRSERDVGGEEAMTANSQFTVPTPSNIRRSSQTKSSLFQSETFEWPTAN